MSGLILHTCPATGRICERTFCDGRQCAPLPMNHTGTNILPPQALMWVCPNCGHGNQHELGVCNGCAQPRLQAA